MTPSAQPFESTTPPTSSRITGRLTNISLGFHEHMTTGCALCPQTSNLSLCTGCEAVEYCSALHRFHHVAHISTCISIQTLRRQAVKLERRLWRAIRRRLGPDFQTGDLWALSRCRNYLKTQYAYAQALLQTNTNIGVTRAAEALEKGLVLNSSDDLGFRYQLYALYLRLGQEQKFYNFCVWWRTEICARDADEGERRTMMEQRLSNRMVELLRSPFPVHESLEPYVWGPMTEDQVRRLEDDDEYEPANMFESFPVFLEEDENREPKATPMDLVPLLLLKVRLLTDLLAIRRCRKKVGPQVPQEILDMVLRYIPEVADLAKTQYENVMEQEDLRPHIQDLKRQIEQIINEICQVNDNFGRLRELAEIDGPTRDLLNWLGQGSPSDPQDLPVGGVEEMLMTLYYSQSLYDETSGAKEVLLGLFAKLRRT